MTKSKAASDNQQSLTGFGHGTFVSLDVGKRIRLDGLVDFWPATGAWRAIRDDDENSAASGTGTSSMLAYLRRERERAGHQVPEPSALASNRKVTCHYCGEKAELHGGLAVFPDRWDLGDRMFWVCWPCDAWVGCHRGTDRPFGQLANEELRHARQSAHAAFDPIWQQGRMSRPGAYDWLSGQLKLAREDCHIGLLSLEQCRQVSDLVWENFGRFDA